MKLTNFQMNVAKQALDTSAPAKYAVESALRHLERAWQLIETMPEIAVFVAITAEEEAATAVFHALKKRVYNGAKQINAKNHRHKGALYPFILGVKKAFSSVLAVWSVRLLFQENSAHGKQLRTGILVASKSDCDQFAMPDPPLHIFIKPKHNEIFDLQKYVEQVATERGTADIIKYVDKVANARNLMLYASSNHMPSVDNPRDLVSDKHTAVFALLSLYLLIEPYDTIQNLPQIALTAFLKVLKADKSKALDP